MGCVVDMGSTINNNDDDLACFHGNTSSRKFYEGDPRGKVYAAVMTLFGVLDIPLIFFAVKLWRGVHPSVLGEEGNMPSEMKITLIMSNIVILGLFSLIYWIQVKVYKLECKT